MHRHTCAITLQSFQMARGPPLQDRFTLPCSATGHSQTFTALLMRSRAHLSRNPHNTHISSAIQRTQTAPMTPSPWLLPWISSSIITTHLSTHQSEETWSTSWPRTCLASTLRPRSVSPPPKKQIGDAFLFRHPHKLTRLQQACVSWIEACYWKFTHFVSHGPFRCERMFFLTICQKKNISWHASAWSRGAKRVYSTRKRSNKQYVSFSCACSIALCYSLSNKGWSTCVQACFSASVSISIRIQYMEPRTDNVHMGPRTRTTYWRISHPWLRGGGSLRV